MVCELTPADGCVSALPRVLQKWLAKNWRDLIEDAEK